MGLMEHQNVHHFRSIRSLRGGHLHVHDLVDIMQVFQVKEARRLNEILWLDLVSHIVCTHHDV